MFGISPQELILIKCLPEARARMFAAHLIVEYVRSNYTSHWAIQHSYDPSLSFVFSTSRKRWEVSCMEGLLHDLSDAAPELCFDVDLLWNDVLDIINKKAGRGVRACISESCPLTRFINRQVRRIDMPKIGYRLAIESSVGLRLAGLAIDGADAVPDLLTYPRYMV